MTDGEVKRLDTTIVFLLRDNEVLLAMKKRGFGAGHWNGTGGKREPGETAEACAVRETFEEIGVKTLHLEKVADMTFHELHEGTPSIVHSDVYICEAWEGEPVETDEMAPRWFDIPAIPLDSMWPDDAFWLPQVLAGKKLRCSFTFDEHTVITNSTVTIVEGFAHA